MGIIISFIVGFACGWGWCVLGVLRVLAKAEESERTPT